MNAIGSGDLDKLKVIFLGASGVGKTTVITKFIDQCFVETNIPTIGIDFTGKTVIVDGRAVRIQIWDTAGQERFHSLIPAYIREARGAVVMFDVTSRDTFAELHKWVDIVRKKSTTDVAIMICGNKSDREDREISEEEGKRMAEELGTTYCETSAKAGHNINALFEAIARQSLATTHEAPSEEKVVLDSFEAHRDREKNSCAC